MKLVAVFLILFRYGLLAQDSCNTTNDTIVCEGVDKTMINNFFKTVINTETIATILIQNTTFPKLKFENENETIFNNVKSINIHNNEFQKINLIPEMFPNLLHLNASNNRLDEIPNLYNFTNLQYVDLRHNIINDYKLIQNISSEELHLEDNLLDCGTNFTRVCSGSKYVIDICNKTFVDNQIYCKFNSTQNNIENSNIYSIVDTVLGCILMVSISIILMILKKKFNLVSVPNSIEKELEEIKKTIII